MSGQCLRLGLGVLGVVEDALLVQLVEALQLVGRAGATARASSLLDVLLERVVAGLGIGDGVLAFTYTQAERSRSPLGRAVVRRQAWLFFPLLMLEGFHLHIASIRSLLPGGTRSGLRVVQGILDDVADIAFCHLTNHDVVRHKLVGRIVAAYDKFEATDAPVPPRTR